MIKYTLRCEAGHEFEAWFDSMAGFDDQKAKGWLSCAVCGSSNVNKAIMAPNVRTSEKVEHPAPLPIDLSNVDNVGDRFAQTVRDIHEGLEEERPIHGQATPDEIRGLEADGLAENVRAIKKVSTH